MAVILNYLFRCNINIKKMTKKTGIVVLILGLLLTIFTTVTFFTRERVAKIGDVNITANKRHHLKWSPLVGIAVMGVGGVMLWMSPKK
jgi:mannose/fructose/N-acetylgalactosamine-specific phosphotransferase system component IIC